MSEVKLDHFKRAAAEIGSRGDNDTLPFDIDVRFIKDKQTELAELAFAYFSRINKLTGKDRIYSAIKPIPVYSERLLVPSGSSGFRVTTKIHTFWNLFLNGIGIAIAEAHEPLRSDRAHSYRYINEGEKLFDQHASWRAFREASVEECRRIDGEVVVVETDISSFYQQVYHHHIEHCINDLFPDNPSVALQIDRLLSKISSGRSFGLPVGGQAARIIAELILSNIDRALDDESIIWRRYVDDFVLVTNSHSEAYAALAKLSHALANYGLSLNKTKTTIIRGNHFCDYVEAQLGLAGNVNSELREIDLHFDPYSDAPDEEYGRLKEVVQAIDIQNFLDIELEKGQPDSFIVSQIGRSLRYHRPEVTIQLCRTILAPANLNAFRGSWATIMRGVQAVRSNEIFSEIFDEIDDLLDLIPGHSSHLLIAEVSCLHYLRAIRFKRTVDRGQYVWNLYNASQLQVIRRACIDCWMNWKDRNKFGALINQWNTMPPEVQRMLWLSAKEFDDEGSHFQNRAGPQAKTGWVMGLEGCVNDSGVYTKHDAEDRSAKSDITFAELYIEWCKKWEN